MRSHAAHDVAGNETVIDGQKRALELAVHGAPLPSILEELVRTLEAQSTNNVLGSILLLDGTQLRHGAAPSLPAEYNAAIDGIEIGPTVGSCGTAAYTGKIVVVEDIATDPLWASFKALAGRFELRACWSMPIIASDGAVLGTFAMYHRVVTAPSERDREIVSLLAHTAGVILERERQTRLRVEAEAQLRRATEEQLARLATMFAHAPAGIALLRGPEHVFDVANPAYEQLAGRSSITGKRVRDVLPELEGQGIFELLDNVYRTGTPYVGRAQRVSLRRTADGAPEEVYFDFLYQPIPGPDGRTEAILVLAFEVTQLVHAHALSGAMAEQSLAVQRALLELRTAKERAEQRVRELEQQHTR
jgi:PAS domain-containing protein